MFQSRVPRFSPHPNTAPVRSSLASVLSAVVFALAALPSMAHQVPNLTLEADFTSNGAAEFRLNLDPRLFLAEDPRSMPPIPAPWFRDQSETEKQDTLANARRYVEAAVTFFVDEQRLEIPQWTFQAIDGATGMPFSDETAEIHFLARASVQLPSQANAYSVRLEIAAKAPTVLLNRLDGEQSRYPQILFPGETSRPFRYQAVGAAPASTPAVENASIPTLPSSGDDMAADSPAQPQRANTNSAASPERFSPGWIGWALILTACVWLTARLVRRRASSASARSSS